MLSIMPIVLRAFLTTILLSPVLLPPGAAFQNPPSTQKPPTPSVTSSDPGSTIMDGPKTDPLGPRLRGETVVRGTVRMPAGPGNRPPQIVVAATARGGAYNAVIRGHDFFFSVPNPKVADLISQLEKAVGSPP